jgi:alpha-glucosidase
VSASDPPTAAGPHSRQVRPWWEPGVIYQVYPRSFADSDGDGTGDLRGVLDRLDHLSWLGVDAIWLSPVFRSPMKDFGYDISDYCDVDPVFGRLADLDALVEEAHRRGLRLILDFVPNHTSDQHPWFIESRASRTNPRRDWYVWHDAGPDGSPPNNWLAMFGGPAWTWDEPTRQFFYHAFLASQPDLNWRNPAVRAAMYDVLRFWLDRGIDGFRIDVITHLLEDEQLRDNPPNPDYRLGQPTEASLLSTRTIDQPELQAIVGEIRQVIEEYEHRLLIGEAYLPIDRLMAYYGGGRGIHMPFNFQLLAMPWDARTIGAAIRTYEDHLPPDAWPNWVLGNHDQSRIATRVGEAQARVAAMLLLTLRGTPTIYYGDEIGMRDVLIPPERRVDPAWHDGSGTGRDRCRTPMQWDRAPGGGFTTGEPWLPFAADQPTRNVATQCGDPHSMLTLHRRLIELRRANPALAIGRYEPIGVGDHTLAYRRAWDDGSFAVALNLAGAPVEVEIGGSGAIALTTGVTRAGERVERSVRLGADEGVVVALDAPA